MTCALLVQGPWNTQWLERFDHYDQVFDEIIISTYKRDMVQIAAHSTLIDNHKVRVVLNDEAFPPGVDWYGNIWHQCKTTLNGLRVVSSDHVIKCRTDEYWSNLNLMRHMVCSDVRHVSINIYFKKWNVFPLHIGDHLFGGRTHRLRKGFGLLQQLLSVDHFQNRARAAEQKITAALLMSEGETPAWQDCREQLRRHWQIQDARLLEPFAFSAPSVNTFGTTLAEVAECERNNHTVAFFDHVDKYLE